VWRGFGQVLQRRAVYLCAVDIRLGAAAKRSPDEQVIRAAVSLWEEIERRKRSDSVGTTLPKPAVISAGNLGV